jgi:hypothetical protein
MLDLSTAHVPGPDPDFGDVRTADHTHGWVVFVAPGLPKFTRSFPDWLLPVWNKAVELECTLINFDTDAECCEDFPTFDW